MSVRSDENDYLERLRKYQKNSYRWGNLFGFIHNLLQLIILGGAAVVPFLLIISAVPKLVPTIISALVAVAAALAGYYKYGEISRKDRLISDTLMREMALYQFRGGPYKDLDPDTAFSTLVNRGEILLQQLSQQYFSFMEPKQNQTLDQGQATTSNNETNVM